VVAGRRALVGPGAGWRWGSAAGAGRGPAVPAVTGDGKPATTKALAAAGVTVMGDCDPLRPLAASAAVSDWPPAVFSVAVKVPVPLVSVASAGSTAWGSLLLKWTVPP